MKKNLPVPAGEGAQRSAQDSGPLGFETRSGYWAKSRPLAERVVGSTPMDIPLDQRAASLLPEIQRPHVAPLGFREGMAIASGILPGAGIELASGNSSHVFLIRNPKRALLSPI